MNKIEFNKALKERKMVYGTCVTIDAPGLSNIHKSLGMDFAFIDTEHNAIDRFTLARMCAAYNQAEVAPIVRIPMPDPYWACMTIDAGATGIIIPYAETVNQVMDLIGAVKYRPLKGERLKRALAGEELEPALAQRLKTQNAGLSTIINIESVPALDNLETLAQIEELDAFLIGPSDLSFSLGVPNDFTNPIFLDAVSYILKISKKYGMSCGNHYSEDTESIINWCKEGMNFVTYATDRKMLANGMAHDFGEIKSAAGDIQTESQESYHV